MLELKQIEESILNGATIADIAAQSNCSWHEAAAELDRLKIQRPNAQSSISADQMVRQYLGLIEDTQHARPEDLVRGPDGQTFGIPPNFSVRAPNLNAIFEHFHGKSGYVDPYTGESTGERVFIVNASDQNPGRPRNLLITNIETLGPRSISERFSDWMRPITETFDYSHYQCAWDFSLTITRSYDALVGGTYSQEYMDALFGRWVGQPLAQYGSVVDPEREPVFGFSKPYEVAWWAWEQLTHAGLLKGLVELRVRSSIGRNARTVILRDDDVQNVILGWLMKNGQLSSSIVMATNPPPKFSPGSLITK